MSIFNGLDDAINFWLGIDNTWLWRSSQLNYTHRRTLQLLCERDSPVGDGLALCGALADRANNTWLAAGALRNTRPRSNNWRHQKNLGYDERNPSDEVVLERVIVSVTDSNWCNQVPVEQDLLGVKQGKKIDLVHRVGSEFSIVELKTSDGYTPLSAAGQVLKYGVVYAFYRTAADLDFDRTQSEILNASKLNLVVLAPAAFYSPFVELGDWLLRFEKNLNDGLARFSAQSSPRLPTMSFQFQAFPRDFVWSASRANDIEGHKEVLWALHHRGPAMDG